MRRLLSAHPLPNVLPRHFQGTAWLALVTFDAARLQVVGRLARRLTGE